MASKVVFPSFSGEEYQSYEVRQLVSALELRFQALEEDQESLFDTGDTGFELDSRYSQIGHTHTESEVTDLQDYLLDITGESIFDLIDVTGTPTLNQVLQWDGSQFVPTSASAASVALDDLTDVTVPAPIDGDVLTYNVTTMQWEAVTTAAASTSFFDLTDTNLSGQLQYDLVFNASGTEWQPTLGQVAWNPVTSSLVLANDNAIDWLNVAGSQVEHLTFEEIGTAGTSMDYYIVDEQTPSTTSSETGVGGYVVTDTGMDVSQAGMVNGDAYMIFFKSVIGNDNNSSVADNQFKIVASGSDLTGSEVIYESPILSGLFSLGAAYQYCGVFTANTAGANIQTMHSSGSPSPDYVYSYREEALILNLDTDVPNHERSTFNNPTTPLELTGSWQSTSASVTLGAGDWVVFYSLIFDGFNGSTQCYAGLNVDGTDYDLQGVVAASTSESQSVGGMFYVDGFAGGNVTVRARSSSGVVIADVPYACLVCLPLSDFAEGYGSQDLSATHTTYDVINTDQTAIELNIASIQETTADAITLSWASCEFDGSQEYLATEIQEDLNSAGLARTGSNNDVNRKASTGLSNSSQTCGIRDSAGSFTAGDSLDVLNVVKAKAGSTSLWDFRYHGVAYISFATGSTIEEKFIVGDPSYITRIDGTKAEIANNIGISWEDSVGVDYQFLNLDATDDFYVGDPLFDTIIDGLTTTIDSTLNVTGNATFDLDVDIDGILESDHVIAGDPGLEGTGITVNGTLYESVLKASDIGGTHAAQFIMHRHSTTLPAAIVGARSKSDTTAHTIGADNDVLLGIYAAGWDGVDSYSLSSAIDFQIDGTPGANDMPGQISFYTAADGTEALLERVRIRADGKFEIVDPGGTDYASHYHNGVSYLTDFTNTSLWNIDIGTTTNGVAFIDTGQAKVWVNQADSELQVRDGWGFRISNSDDLNYATFIHSGGDLNITTVNTADISIGETGTRVILPSATDVSSGSTDHPFQIGTVAGIHMKFDSNEIMVRNIGAASPLHLQGDGGDVTLGIVDPADDVFLDLYTGSAGGVRIYGDNGTSLARFWEDNTDFNTDFTTTVSWNVTGLTVMELFADWYARSGSTLTMWDSGDVDTFDLQHTGSHGQMTTGGVAGGDIRIVPAGGGVDLRTGTLLRVRGPANTGYFEFSHDDTDSLLRFFSTTDFNIRGATVKIWDGGFTDNAAFSHDGTDFDTVFFQTVDWDVTGLTGEMFVDADLRVSGDFTTSGTLTSINTSDLNIADNLIVLNSDAVHPPTENAGIEVYRGGTENDVSVLWNETSDTWTLTNDGTTWYDIITANDIPTGGLIVDGTGTDNTLRWSGSAWVENASAQIATTGIISTPEVWGNGNNFVVLGGQDSGTAQPYAGYNIDMAAGVASHLLTGAIAGVLYQNSGDISFYSDTSQTAATTSAPVFVIDSAGSHSLAGDLDIVGTGALTAVSYGGIAEGDLVSKSAVESIGAIWGFDGTYTQFRHATTAQVRIIQSGATLDNKNWAWIATSEQLDLRTYDDAWSGQSNIMSTTRTGTTIDSIAFGGPVTATSYDGVDLTTGGAATNYLDETGNYSVPGIAAANLGDLSDVDLTGVATGDMLYKSAGDWLDTAGKMTWDASNARLTLVDNGTADSMYLSETGAQAQWVTDTNPIYLYPVGVNTATFSSTLTTFATDVSIIGAGLQLTVDDGSAAAPGIISDADANTGFYWGGANIGVAVDGSQTAQFSSTYTRSFQQIWCDEGVSVTGGVSDIGQVGQTAFIDVAGGRGRFGSYNWDTTAWTPLTLQGLDLLINSSGGDTVFQTNSSTRMTLTNTTLIASAIDPDFDAITATSYGGITEANLVDKSAAEVIAGSWDFTGLTEIKSGGDLTFFNASDLAAATLRSTAGSDFAIINTSAVDMEISGFTTLIVDSPMTSTSYNGVALTDAGAATNYLDETGSYSVPAGTYTPEDWIRADVADTKSSGILRFNDGVALTLGTGDDISHSWSGSQYNLSGSGLWNIDGFSTVRFSSSIGGEMLLLTDTGGAGVVANPFIGFDDSANVRQGYVGFGSISNADLYLKSDIGGLRLDSAGTILVGTGAVYPNIDMNFTLLDMVPGATTEGFRLLASGDNTIIRPRDAAGTAWDTGADFSYDRSLSRWTFDSTVSVGGGFLYLLSGTTLNIYNNASSLFGSITHDETDLVIDTNTGGGDINLTPDGGAVNISGALTTSDDVTIASSSPQIFVQDTAGGTANENNWIIRGDADVFRIQTANDASPTAGIDEVIYAARTGGTLNTVRMGNFDFEVDQTVGAGQDNYVLTYDQGDGLISLEVAAGGAPSFPLDAADNEQIRYGTGQDVTMDWDGVDFEIEGLAANQTINFRDGFHLRLWDSTDTDWVDFHNDITNLVITDSGLANIDLDAMGIILPNVTFLWSDNAADSAQYRLIGMDATNHTLVGGTTGSGEVHLHHDDQVTISTLDAASTGTTSGAHVLEHGSTTTFHDIGFNTLPSFNFNASDTLEAGHCGHVTGKDNTTTTYQLTGPTSADVDFPVDGVATVMNLGASGDYQITDTATCTMYYCDGTAAPVDITLSAELEPGGVITLYRYSTTAIYIFGSGLNLA